MEQCLRIALSVVFLSAHLQAASVCLPLVSPTTANYSPAELGLNYLLDNVSCGPNVTFTSPTNVDMNCSAVAIKYFKDGLNHAKSNCSDEWERIVDTQNHMEHREKSATQECVMPETLSECQWSDKKPFSEFVADFQKLIARIAAQAALSQN